MLPAGWRQQNPATLLYTYKYIVAECSRFVAVDRIKWAKMRQNQKMEIVAILQLAKGLG